ncbi:hypothetical protein UPYG_G00223740 [Umbra pygmaea]|uniref:Coiled-coil domain-containing protein 9B n=1 Tax=Umbra pygmaea TaxID=75934 RepID=A0ABD0WDQ8_UMBPY
MAYYIPGGKMDGVDLKYMQEEMGCFEEQLHCVDHDSSSLNLLPWLSMGMYAASPVRRRGCCLSFGASPGFNPDMDPTPGDVMLKKEHKDIELDKKIEALRRKNEALMKRYQEVEEDKKRAEEEGKVPQSQKGKPGDLTITVNKSTSDSRVVMTKPGKDASPLPKEDQEPKEKTVEGNLLSSGRGRRRQLLVTMAGKTKGKRLVSERLETRPGLLDVKGPGEEIQWQYRIESAGRGKQPHQGKRAPQDDVSQPKGVTEPEPRYQGPESQGPGPGADADLSMPTSKEEQQEYVRWKKEREQIDKERLARHKNAKGQWRRAWDMDKTDNMFQDKSLGGKEQGPTLRGGRRDQPKSIASSRDQQLRGKDKGGKNVPVVSSRAKGKERLTGRAKRWDASKDEEDFQATKASLEEFLEDRDALVDSNIEGSTTEIPLVKDGDLKMDTSSILDIVKSDRVERRHTGPDLDQTKNIRAPADEEGISRHRKADGSSPQSREKKVRFSEVPKEPAACKKPSTEAQNLTRSETKGARPLKFASPRKNNQQWSELKQAHRDHQGAGEDQRGAQSLPNGQKGGQDCPPCLDASKSGCAHSGHKSVLGPVLPIPQSDFKDPPEERAVQPSPHATSNRNTVPLTELIDFNLSGQNLGLAQAHPVCSTSMDAVRTD